MNTQVNRALAAMQLAKQQKDAQEPVAPLTNLFDSQVQPNQDANLTKEPIIHSNVLQSTYLNKNIHVTSTPAPISTETTPKFTRVDISIAGTPHRINCPTSEVDNVNRTADRLNNNLKEIRRSVSGKSPTNEELLVLHCLELYDEMAELKKLRQNELINNERVSALLDKILKDAKTIL